MAKGTITPSAIAVNNIQTLPDLVVGQASNLKLLFDKGDSDQQTYINTVLIPELNGDDGSKKIGHNSVNIVADNVNEAIEEVRQIAVDAQAGTIIDGSITDLKLSNAPTEIKQRVIDLTDDFSNFQADYEYQAPTVVGQQIRVQKLGVSLISKFYLSTPVTGGAITISTDGGATSIALKDGEGNAVTELTAGLKEVAYVAPFFILRSSGGLQEFFGDGSDGTIPDLNLVTIAPNGGTVANLWDMNTGTVFTTGTLSNSGVQVVFQIDFGRQFWISSVWHWGLSTSVISQNIRYQVSNDGTTWINSANATNTNTTPENNSQNFTAGLYRYLRLIKESGGSNCTLSVQGITINSIPGVDTQTTKVWRILEPSTLNGGAVVKQYTEYVLPVGYEHTTQKPCQGLIIYSQGNATVNGVLDMSQKAGLAPNGNAIPMLITKKAFKTAKTSSLLHFDNNITDDNGRVWTNNGGATFDATNKKFGTHAISFNGTSQWIDTPASDDFSFGNDDFTIDCWIRSTTNGVTQTIFSTNSNSANGLYLQKINTNEFRFVIYYSSSDYLDIRSSSQYSDSLFHHVVVSKIGNIVYLFVDGVLKSQGISGNSLRSISKLTIGRDGEVASSYFAGQIDEFRIIKGKAMYTANFTPPTSAYVYQATYVDEPKTLEKYFQLTNVLQTLRGGYGGNGGYGGGYSGSTGRQTSVGIGGAGRQNLGGFGGGGSGGSNGSSTPAIGGSILNAEIGGGFASVKIDNSAVCNASAIGVNGSGAIGTLYNATGTISTGKVYGGGSGGTGATSTSTAPSSTPDSQYTGGLAMLIAKGNITIAGTIRSNGGVGSNGSNGVGVAGGGGGGGGSGGGVIALFYGGTYTNTGTVQVNGGAGGTGGAGAGTGEAGGAGTSGSVGTIHTQKL